MHLLENSKTYSSIQKIDTDFYKSFTNQCIKKLITSVCVFLKVFYLKQHFLISLKIIELILRCV